MAQNVIITKKEAQQKEKGGIRADASLILIIF